MTTPKTPCIKLVMLFVICGSILAARPAPAALSGSVATLDTAAVSKLPPFVDANKKIAARWKEMTAQLDQERKTKHLKPADLQSRWGQMQKQLDALRTSLLQPLNHRVVESIAEVAQERHLQAVVDKKIVLVGLPDITPDVLKKFDQNPTGNASSTPPHGAAIGFVNQAQIRNLKGFRDAQAQMVAFYSNLSKQMATTEKKADDKQKARLGRDMSSKLQAKRQALFGPMEKRVQGAIDDVASNQSVSLILDKREILWGGTDLTAPVINQINRLGFMTVPAGR